MLINTMRKRTPLLSLIIIEVVVAILVAGLPMLVGFYRGGADTLNKIISSLIPVDLLLPWSIGLTLIALAVDFLNRTLYKGTDVSTKIWIWLSVIAAEVAPSVQSTLRIIGGVMVTFVLIWWFNEQQSFVWNVAQHFLFIGVVALMEAVAIRAAVDWLGVKYPRKAQES